MIHQSHGIQGFGVKSTKHIDREHFYLEKKSDIQKQIFSQGTEKVLEFLMPRISQVRASAPNHINHRFYLYC